MEYVYKISTIGIDDLVKSRTDLESKHNRFSAFKNYGDIEYFNTVDILKEENLTYLDITWNDALLYVKNSECIGAIHKDGNILGAFTWAINWVWGESCILNYWTDEQISSSIISSDGSKYSRIAAKTNLPPAKTYTMNPGAYLIKTSTFHKGSNGGPGNRFALSLRTRSSPFSTWEETVEHFSNIII